MSMCLKKSQGGQIMSAAAPLSRTSTAGDDDIGRGSFRGKAVASV